MRSPPHCDSGFGTAKTIRNAPFAARENQSQRTGPMSRGKTGCVSAQPEIEACHHVARGDEDEKRLAWGTSFETNERLNRIVVDRPTEPVHGLRGIRKHTVALEMNDRIRDSRFNLRR
jgi:hypothetical protein